jgi:hypothetical protein
VSKKSTTYFRALGLTTPATSKRKASKAIADGSTPFIDEDKEARRAALQRSHEIRQFEIELYWKRATYFWVLQAAVFTALGLIWKDGAKQIPEIVPVALASLGFLTAAAGWFSAQGSKFWQENWERHIDMLEEEFEGKLHQTAWVGKMGVRWSVSNINDRLILFFVIFWSLISLVVSYNAVPTWSFCLTICWDQMEFVQPSIIFINCLTLGGLAWLYCQKTNLRGTKPDWPTEKLPDEIQTEQPNLFFARNEAPLIMKRGQAE